MKPANFDDANVVFATDQPEYLLLPAHKSEDGTVTTCWRLTWRSRLRVLWSGRLYIQVLTFNNPLQPIKPSVERPEL